MQFNWFRIYEKKEKKPQACLFSYESKPTWSNAFTYQNIVKEPEAGFSRNWVVEIGLKKYIHSNSLFINTCQFIAFAAEIPPASSPEWESLMQVGVTTDFSKLMFFLK